MTGFSAEFYYGHEVPTGSGLIPDFILVLRKADKTALVLGEIDNGTENVTSPTGYSLASKFRAYASYFDSGSYLKDFAWAGTLRGFRVALVVPAGRLRHVQQLVAAEQFDFVLCTTFDLLRQGLHRPIWSTHDGTIVDLLGRRGDLLQDLLREKVEPSLPTDEQRNC